MSHLKSLNRYLTLLKYNCLYKSKCSSVIQYAQTTNYSKSANDDKSNLQLGDMSSKYKPFKEEESDLILDVFEERERFKYHKDLLDEHDMPEEDDIYKGINLQRGITGVYDIDDLVELLKRENAVDIFVAYVPPDHNYVDYIVVVTGKSKKHMLAITQFVRKVYKQKRNESDDIPKVEGENSNEWMAMDLGNIALHVFSPDAREYYDLDSLWAVGPEYDKEFNKKDDIVDMLEKHSMFLKDLHPAT